MFMCWTLHRGDVNDVIDDADVAHERLYGYKQGSMWVYMRANMGSREQAVMGLES